MVDGGIDPYFESHLDETTVLTHLMVDFDYMESKLAHTTAQGRRSIGTSARSTTRMPTWSEIPRCDPRDAFCITLKPGPIGSEVYHICHDE